MGGLVVIIPVTARIVLHSRHPYTLAKYDEVQVGMTLDQVRGILGVGPTDGLAATGSASFEWENGDNSGITVGFLNGRVRSKTHTPGLR